LRRRADAHWPARQGQPAGRRAHAARAQAARARRALATRPRLLLLDEIAGGLTEHECRHLIGTIRAIHAAGTAIIWIEHVVQALVAVVDRLVVINFGRLLADGEPRRVMADPAVQDVYLGIRREPARDP